MSRSTRKSCCVIGASLHGLAAAGALQDQFDIEILEKNSDIGGPWRNGGYPSLVTNTPASAFHFPGYPPSDPEYATPQGRVTGLAVYKYLCDFIEQTGIKQCIRYEHAVVLVEPQGNQWQVTFQHDQKRDTKVYDKLVIATGLFSKPNIPSWASSYIEDPAVCHTSDLYCSELRRQLVHTRTKANGKRRIVIVGSSKSALDTATWLAQETDHDIQLIVRSTPLPTAGPLNGRLNIKWGTLTRLAASFSPYFSGAEGTSCSSWLHQNIIGKRLCATFWKGIRASAIRANEYFASSNAKLLLPEDPLYAWHHPTKVFPRTPGFFELVQSDRIEIIRGEVVDLSKESDSSFKVIIKSLDEQDDARTAIFADTVVLATGYLNNFSSFFADDVKRQMLLSGKTADLDDETRSHWQHLDHNAARKLRQSIPLLPTREFDNVSDLSNNPDRLHRRLVPLSHLDARNIVFSGSAVTFSSMIVAGLQAEWIARYFSNSHPLQVPNREVAEEGIALSTNFSAMRHGEKESLDGAALAFDLLPYVGSLCEDMGYSAKRKQSWIAEKLMPYNAQDYAQIVTDRQAFNDMQRSTPQSKTK